MEEFVQIGAQLGENIVAPCPELRSSSREIVRLQIFTLLWMLIECVAALTSSWKARSPALFAFGSDSAVELLSAMVVLLQFIPSFRLSQARAAKCAGILLFFLAGIVAFTSVGALILRIEPDTSWVGIGVTVAALVIMPTLTWRKRRAGLIAKNAALLADAVQSATCAYLAGVTLCGLAINAVFHVRWIDPLAALVAIPIICIEGRRSLRGDACQCC
jgi:divalent metal cation (Fe/Co/Zn/Cd) transporter